MDVDGREMLISCGAALFGLRLAVWQAGFRPVVEFLPGWPGLDPLARVHLSARAAPGPGERQLLSAVWRRHTHRGPFAREPLPAGLLSALRRDAEAESAALVLVDGHGPRALARLVRAAQRRQAGDETLAAEVRSWTSPDAARDGVPARAYVARPTHSPGAGVRGPSDPLGPPPGGTRLRSGSRMGAAGRRGSGSDGDRGVGHGG
jgi:hypothetical protein